MRYKAVIFDLDGTLLDTINDLCTSVNTGLQKYGYPKRTRKEVEDNIGHGFRWLINSLIPGGAENPDSEKVREFHLKYYPEHCNVLTKPFPGVTELIRYLSEHEYKLAVVSNKQDDATRRLIRQYFGNAVSVTVGEKSGIPRKPEPDMLLNAMKELGSTPEECIYVGDSEVDIQTAKAAGVKCISVSWGYRRREALLGFGAELMADKPEEIIKLV